MSTANWQNIAGSKKFFSQYPLINYLVSAPENVINVRDTLMIGTASKCISKCVRNIAMTTTVSVPKVIFLQVPEFSG